MKKGNEKRIEKKEYSIKYDISNIKGIIKKKIYLDIIRKEDNKKIRWEDKKFNWNNGDLKNLHKRILEELEINKDFDYREENSLYQESRISNILYWIIKYYNPSSNSNEKMRNQSEKYIKLYFENIEFKYIQLIEIDLDKKEKEELKEKEEKEKMEKILEKMNG